MKTIFDKELQVKPIVSSANDIIRKGKVNS